MNYQKTMVEDAISVEEIYTVLRPDRTELYAGCGEAHPFPEIIYLMHGTHEVLIDGVSYPFEEGQMIIYAPNSYHEAASRPNEHTEAAILTFGSSSAILPALYNRIISLTPKQRQLFTTIIDEGVRYFCGCSPSSGLAGMQLRDGITPQHLWGLKKQIELFLIDVSKSCTMRQEQSDLSRRWDMEFFNAVQWLQAHLCEPLTLAKIAAGCSMSVSKLKLLFRTKAGMGPIDYVIRLRMEHAQAMIDEGKWNFTEISEQLGFTSLHYFSRQFKKVTGLSPSAYAQQPHS